MNRNELLNAAYNDIAYNRANIRKIIYDETGINTPDPNIELIEANSDMNTLLTMRNL